MKEKKLLYVMLCVVACLLIAAIVVTLLLINELKNPTSVSPSAVVSTALPTAIPTVMPTEAPTPTPTLVPTPEPTATPIPTPTPTPTPEPVTTDFPKDGLKVVPEGDELIPGTKEVTVCTNGSLNVRTGPGTDYKAISTVKLGNTLRAYGIKDGWFLVEYKSGKTGWISGKYAFGDWMFDLGINGNLDGLTKPEQVCTPVVRYIFSSDGANVRTDPNPAATLITTWKDRLQVIQLGSTGSWVFCNYKGTFGWVSESNFSDTPLSSLSDGSYMYSFGEDVALTAVGDVWTLKVDIDKPVILTEEETDTVKAGTDVTKNGFTVSASEYADGAVEFLWSKAYKGYQVIYYNVLATYKSSTATLVLDEDTAIKDYMYPVYVDDFTSSETKTYGVSNGIANFTGGDSLIAYRKLMKNKELWMGMFGDITVEDGIVTELISDYAP